MHFRLLKGKCCKNAGCCRYNVRQKWLGFVSLGFDLAHLCAAVIFFFFLSGEVKRKFYTGSTCPFLASDQTFSFHLGLTSHWGGSPVPSSGFRHIILPLSNLYCLCCWKGLWKVRFLHLGPMCSFWHPSTKEGLFVNQKDFLLEQGLDHHSLFLLKGCTWICFSYFPVAFKSFQKLIFLASQFSPNSTSVSLPW